MLFTVPIQLNSHTSPHGVVSIVPNCTRATSRTACPRHTQSAEERIERCRAIGGTPAQRRRPARLNSVDARRRDATCLVSRGQNHTVRGTIEADSVFPTPARNLNIMRLWNHVRQPVSHVGTHDGSATHLSTLTYTRTSAEGRNMCSASLPGAMCTWFRSLRLKPLSLW